MAALSELSSKQLCVPEHGLLAPKTLESLNCSQEVTPQDEQSARSTCSWFDPDALALLGSSIPSGLELWRLRLRFGLPTQVALGERFRVAVDLVDEMGQPPPPSQLAQLAQSLRPPLLQLLPDQDGGSPGRVTLRVALIPSKSPAKWVFDASIHCNEAVSTPAAVSCSLLVALDPASDACNAYTAFHQDFQRFCPHSVWLADHTLVLPLQSASIQVTLTPTHSPGLHPTCTTCRRLFSLPSPQEPDSSDRSIAITENYGDAMGAHVWDASILLSFALLTAAPHLDSLDSIGEPAAMAELGAGCGLFACVFRSLYAASATAIVLTERPESAQLLQHNVELNRAACGPHGPPVHVVPLVWGSQPLPPALATHKEAQDAGAVFAADVLYHWDAHAALLSTLKALATRTTSFQVVIAHRHRGVATSRKLEAVLARCGRHYIDNNLKPDAWSDWQVERLEELGKVDLLRLTLRHGGH